MNFEDSLYELLNAFKERKIIHGLNIVIGILIIISFYLSGIEPEIFFQQLKSNELVNAVVKVVSVIALLLLGLLLIDNSKIKYSLEFRNILKTLVYKLSDMLVVAVSTMLGVDAPEIRGKCASEKLAARKAKQFTVQFLRAGRVVELRKIKRGKYFRLLAEVYVDGKNLADALIKANVARPYDGGTRLGWCG